MSWSMPAAAPMRSFWAGLFCICSAGFSPAAWVASQCSNLWQGKQHIQQRGLCWRHGGAGWGQNWESACKHARKQLADCKPAGAEGMEDWAGQGRPSVMRSTTAGCRSRQPAGRCHRCRHWPPLCAWTSAASLPFLVTGGYLLARPRPPRGHEGRTVTELEPSKAPASGRPELGPRAEASANARNLVWTQHRLEAAVPV